MGGPTIEGIDYAFLPQHPDISQLAALGIQFACRYVGPGTADKHLTPKEAQKLSAHGISIVSNAEGSATWLRNGYSAGFDWASRAADQAHDCGMPNDRPIYLSVDWDCTMYEWPSVSSALMGAASALGGPHRVGVYGSVRVMEWARRDGVAQWFWQTYAWSGGRWASGNNIEQYRNGVSLAGGTVDLDRALSIDYGQWNVGGSMFTPDEEQEILGHLRTASMVNWATTCRAYALIQNAEFCYYTIGSEPLIYTDPATGMQYSRREKNEIHSALAAIADRLDDITVPTEETLVRAIREVLLNGVQPL